MDTLGIIYYSNKYGTEQFKRENKVFVSWDLVEWHFMLALHSSSFEELPFGVKLKDYYSLNLSKSAWILKKLPMFSIDFKKCFDSIDWHYETRRLLRQKSLVHEHKKD